jgi:hypothetical protein
MEQWSVGVLKKDGILSDLTLLQYSNTPTLLLVISVEVAE